MSIYMIIYMKVQWNHWKDILWGNDFINPIRLDITEHDYKSALPIQVKSMHGDNNYLRKSSMD